VQTYFAQPIAGGHLAHAKRQYSIGFSGHHFGLGEQSGKRYKHSKSPSVFTENFEYT